MRLLAVCLSGFLAACQTSMNYGPDSPFFRVPAGSELELHRELQIPAEETSVFLQDGELVPRGGLDRFRPWCKFESRVKGITVQTVVPDTFTVTRVVRRWDLVGAMPAPVQVAGISFGSEGTPSHVPFTTAMHLHSPGQPEILRLSCSHWEDLADGRHLSLNQIRVALGPVFSLRLPR